MSSPHVSGIAPYDLLDKSTFLTRFGARNGRDAMLSRLHMLVCRAPTSGTVFEEWLEDVVAWIFSKGTWNNKRPNESETDARCRLLCEAIEELPEVRKSLAASAEIFFQSIDYTRLFTDVGLPSTLGFWKETVSRFSARLLPLKPVGQDGARLVARLVPTPEAAEWILSMSVATRRRLAQVLTLSDSSIEDGIERGMREAAPILAARLGALGVDDEIRSRLRADGNAHGPHHSPWLRLSQEVQQVIEQSADAAVLRSLLAGCHSELEQVEDGLNETGISVDLVFRLELLRAWLKRLQVLLNALEVDEATREVAWQSLERDLIRGAVEDRSAMQLLKMNTRRLAQRLVERAGHSGEKYMTRSRSEQHAMISAAAGGGAITAFMVLIKFLITWSKLPPLFDAFFLGLNYALGFVIMQFAHFSLATKQPSMTAATLAASISDAKNNEQVDLEPLVDQLARASRTQLAALVGNVGMVIPVAVLLGLLVRFIFGRDFLDPVTASKVVSIHHPWLSLTLLYAATTGIWLWLASIIAGAVENWFVLHEMPGAIASNRKLRRLLGPERAAAVARYLTAQISGLGGNIGFGMLLGFMPMLFQLVGIPLEVRHVTFVMGQLVYAGLQQGAASIVSANFLWALATVLMVGLVNFSVSFALALVVALRARGLGLKEQLNLGKAVLVRLRKAPSTFFVAPRDAA
jgi:site-specific recombinase